MPNVNQSSDFITHNYAASIASYSNPAQMNITAGAANTENSATLTEPKASHYTHLGSWVSDPLDGQSIDGTVTIALCLNESDAAVNMNPRVMIYRWITSDVKGENLLSLTTSGTEAPTSWPTSPSTYFSTLPLSSIAFQSGDRIVVEIESFDDNTKQSSYTQGIRFGGASGGQYGSYIQFSNDLTFLQPPVAAFTSNVTSGLVPFSVKFTDQSTNNPTSWNWEYNAGTGWTQFSTLQNPIYTFTSSGTYDIRLTSSNAAGSDEEITLGYITVFPEAGTTSLTIRRIANDGTTVINETTVTYQWMEANLPIHGDGVTHYYHQGPVFIDDPDSIVEEQLRWNPEEDTNVLEKDMGAVKGSNVKDLCNLLGGLPPGKEIRISSSDGWYKYFNYSNVYEYPNRTGPMVITWYCDGLTLYPGHYPDTGYYEAMRLVWLADDSVNTLGPEGIGVHAFGNWDWHESADPQYWYYYSSGGEHYPTTTGLSGKYISTIDILTDEEPQISTPPPAADFIGYIKNEQIVNSGFETGSLPPWSGSTGVLISTAYKRTGSYSASLTTPAGFTRWINQSINFNNATVVAAWRRITSSNTNRFMSFAVDGTEVSNFSISTANYRTDVVDLPSLSGVHTLEIRSINGGSTSMTVYVDDVEDYRIGTSGKAPLSVLFRDSSNGTDITSWSWNFGDGNTSTEQNARHTYPSDGMYTVSLNVTNASGSDIKIKTNYVVVGIQPPVADFTATPRSGMVPLIVQFNDTSTNTPTSWKWAYKNATGSWTQFATTQNPEYTFPAGTYDINLTATNAAGGDDEIKLAYINATSYTPYIDIDISGGIDAWNFQTGTNEDSESVDLAVDTNMASWVVTVHDAGNDGKPAGTEGKMAEWSSGSGYIASGKYLVNALKVKSGTNQYYVTLSGDPQDLQSGTNQGILPFDITIRQDIAETDPALENGHQYHMIVTFTGGSG